MASAIVNRQCHLPNGPEMQRTIGLFNYWWPSRVNLSSLWAKKRKSLRSWFLMDISVMKEGGCFGGGRVHLPTSSLPSLWGQHCDQNYMKYPNTLGKSQMVGGPESPKPNIWMAHSFIRYLYHLLLQGGRLFKQNWSSSRILLLFLIPLSRG